MSEPNTSVPQEQAKRLIIDTDIGVDDAAAIAWLFSQDNVPVEVLGITTVAGNTSVENATNNALNLLDVLDRQAVPVVIGAAKPLERSPSTISALLHGPDGLWFIGSQNPHDLDSLTTDVPSFYRNMARQYPDATLLTLGPLTNLALSIQLYPDEMAQFSEIIVLGGSRQATIPSVDFNFWADPEAAAIVLSSGLAVTMITLEAAGQFRLTKRDLQRIATGGNPAAQLIAQPMNLFAKTLSGFGGATEAHFVDVAAAMYAMRPDIATIAEHALVKVSTVNGLTRGQTFIGDNIGDKVLMIAAEDELNEWSVRTFTDPNFDLETEISAVLSREPDNALVVANLKPKEMKAWFIEAITGD